MHNIEEKRISACDCPNSRGRELITITIETCCRRTCENSEKGAAGSKSKSKTTFDDGENQIGDGENQIGDGEKSRSAVSVAESATKSSDELAAESAVSTHGSKRLFKLPLLLERYHGPGCAMEISVLEKHEDSCMYKKEEVEGRSIDDKVNSYECIGRMVFRTCNPSEVESDSSGVTGAFSGVSPTDFSKALSSNKIHPSSTIAPQREKSKSSSRQISREASASSAPSFYGSVKTTQHSEEGSFKLSKEDSVIPEEQQPVESGRRKARRRRQEQVMVVKAEEFRNPLLFDPPLKKDVKKHYPGDDCKLHGPRNPLLMGTKEFDKVYSSKKTFPAPYYEEDNQIDGQSKEDIYEKSKLSLETISSLTNLSKTGGKNKPGFFGSLFKRSSLKTSSNTDSRKYKK